MLSGRSGRKHLRPRRALDHEEEHVTLFISGVIVGFIAEAVLLVVIYLGLEMRRHGPL